MSAYGTHAKSHPQSLATIAPEATPLDSPLIDGLIAQLADRIAAAIAARQSNTSYLADDWFDSRHAAEYLGVHRDTLRKLAAERSIPSEQDGPGCKLYFKRSDLDAWRHSGGRPRHLAVARSAA